MKAEDFDLFATMLKQRSGLILTREKSYLLESRLLPVTRKWNLKSLEDMAQAIRERRDEAMMAAITEAMMTSDTHFFRDHKLFQFFERTLLPRYIEARRERHQLRFWSAGTASGQEAYSLAMMVADHPDLTGWQIDIIATDLSRELIERAKAGIYTPLEVQRGLPTSLLVKYFQPHGDKWQIAESLRNAVHFREGNLLSDFGPIGMFDVILCRNVLDSFDTPTQKRVVDAISNHLAKDGHIMLGVDEAVDGFSVKSQALDGSGGAIVSLV